MSWAVRRDGGWRAQAPQPVGDTASLLRRLRVRASQDSVTSNSAGGIAFGIDCPLGLPRAYVQRHPSRCRDFRGFLAGLDAMPQWLEVCGQLDEVGGGRPFYPSHPRLGMRRAEHAAALGLDGPACLYRRCDRATATRPAGAPLFWTLGANQSGKAAIAAWRDLVLPALREEPALLHLWPFDGDLATWRSAPASAGRVLLAETYPAEALDQLGLRLASSGPSPRRGSKRRQCDRAALAPGLRAALGALQVGIEPALRAALDDGFGADAAAEDRFDSVLGLICVLSVLGGHRPDEVPPDPWVRRWEGWVLGLAPTAGCDRPATP